MTQASGDFFALQKDNIWIVPALHHNMETTAAVCAAFCAINPDCVAVELAETLQPQLIQAAARLPDISVVMRHTSHGKPLYYLAEPCDAAFEGLRLAQEYGKSAFCIDLDVDNYPSIAEALPDPYSIAKIGLKAYWETYQKLCRSLSHPLDEQRELHMARNLKELSLRYERVLCVCGMAHANKLLTLLDRTHFPEKPSSPTPRTQLYALTETSCREVLPEGGYIPVAYEAARQVYLNGDNQTFPPDRWQLLIDLYKVAASPYAEQQGIPFAGYHLRNLTLFARNYATVTDRLTPTLFQLLTVARGCVDHNYAYEVWQHATAYPWLKNIDNRPEIELSAEDVWGASHMFHFRLRQKNPKSNFSDRWRRTKGSHRYRLQTGIPSFCSHQPEDIAIENFGNYLKNKGTQLLREDNGRTIPFTNSIEDGIDIRETLRHWHEHKLYVKVKGRPPGNVGSVVIIFDTDQSSANTPHKEKYSWATTWHGEHHQESDMAFYATPYGNDIIGPGICRCTYGGFMLTYPPQRVWDVWQDPDYTECTSKAEVLLMAAIDYALTSTVVYVAPTPPRSLLKSYASRFGKKIVYLPLGQLSPTTMQRLRIFHVLESRERRAIADDYIF
jgi:hypothetical protein